MVNYNPGNTSKFKRGQIWWIRKNKEEEIEKSKDPDWHLVTKTRPWLIVSVDNFNATSGSVTAIPICTDHSNRLASYSKNVKIVINGRVSFAKCNEPMSFNWKDINGDYVTTVEARTMERITMELSDYLGGNMEPSLKELEIMIRTKIDRINNQRTIENTQINDILDKMSELLNAANLDIQVQAIPCQKQEEIVVSGDGRKIKERKSKWTIDKMEEFYNLYISDKEEVLKKYKVTPKTAEMYFYKFRKELKK